MTDYCCFCGYEKWNFLPPQISYAGKSKRCLPASVKFPDNWHVMHTENHWANEKTTEDYIKLILLLYVAKKREDLGLMPCHPALVLLDRFKGHQQCTDKIVSLLDSNHIHVRLAIVPGNCTDGLQPLDVSVNKPAKEYLRMKFQQWYSEQVSTQIENGKAVKIDLVLSVVKPLGAQWLIHLNEYMNSNPSIIINGFKHIFD